MIGRVEAFGDDPLDALLARGVEERNSRADKTLALADRAHRRDRLVEQAQPVAQRALREIFAVEIQQVEDLVDDRGRLPQLPHRRLRGDVHARLEPLEARHTLLVERDDLAVDDRLIPAGHRLGDLGRLGILGRAVEKVARLETYLATVDERDRPDPVPLRLVNEVR